MRILHSCKPSNFFHVKQKNFESQIYRNKQNPINETQKRNILLNKFSGFILYFILFIFN